MARGHASTAVQRVQWVRQLLAPQREYGLVTLLSRREGVARQTLYVWAKRGQQALEQAFAPLAPRPERGPDLARQVLSVLVETHASERGIQRCLEQLTGQHVSLGTIVAIIREAERRAQRWLASQSPPGPRPIALDEIYGRDRRGAYLHVVDTASWAVWVAEGPLPADAESWTLALWLAQERGLRWDRAINDGGAAITAALRTVDPAGSHGRDVWHVLHRCSQVQGRLDLRLAQLVARSDTVTRQAARVAAGGRPRGRRACSDPLAHAAELARTRQLADGVSYLCGELHDLLEAVVLARNGVLDTAARQGELDALLELLAELAAAAPGSLQREVEQLHRHLQAALPELVAFAPALDAVQQEAAGELGPAGLALVAWAWQRRAILGPSTDELLAQLPASWRLLAQRLISAWEQAVRASSAVENWHSILRPHLAAHRTLSPGLLALLAVWHNHRLFARGARAGFSPLQLSGMPDAPTDWLVALGYPPATRPSVLARRTAVLRSAPATQKAA